MNKIIVTSKLPVSMILCHCKLPVNTYILPVKKEQTPFLRGLTHLVFRIVEVFKKALIVKGTNSLFELDESICIETSGCEAFCKFASF